MLITEILPDQQINALLVLGRGIDEEGMLSDTGLERAEEAVRISRLLLPRVVVFSGGHSWAQELEGAEVPSEGEAMLAHAMTFMDYNAPVDVSFVAEKISTSTVENLVNSKPLLCLNEVADPTLGMLSDELHFSEGRPQYIGRLTIPGVQIVPFQITAEMVPGAKREEQITNAMTRVIMLGVHKGNDEAIMRRQHWLEKGNATFRGAVKLARSRSDQAFSPSDS